MKTQDIWSKTRTGRLALLLVTAAAVVWPGKPAEAAHPSFEPGDIFVGLRTGEVQWWHANGTLNAILISTVPGKVEGLGHDADGNLYVSHYCADLSVCKTGNAFEKHDTSGIPQGQWGSGYEHEPYSIVFDGSGRGYVGQRGGTGDILEFSAAGELQRSFDPAWENAGTAWIDLGNDGCTMFYTSQGQRVKRFNICTGEQLSDFYTLPTLDKLHQLHVLPNDDVLVASDGQILRLDAIGNLVQTYDVAGEHQLWYGVAPVGDGTFWASNYGTSNVYRFDVETGEVLAGFNTGTPKTTVKGLAVMPGLAASCGP